MRSGSPLSTFSCCVIFISVICSAEVQGDEVEVDGRKNNNGCPYGWVQGAGQCYKLYSGAKSVKSAMEVCARQGASLVNVRSWEESDFLSTLVTPYPEVTNWYTSARRRKGQWNWTTTARSYRRQGKKGNQPRHKAWRFRYKQTPVTEDKWFPGWSSYDFMSSEPQRDWKKRCMALSNRFKYPRDGIRKTHYFYWKADSCTKPEGVHFICQKDAKKETRKQTSECERGDFMCDNGQCIKGYLKCDLKRHCEDYSDELDCPRIVQLVNGPVSFEGRVQLLMKDTDITGSVCGDQFDNRDAQVVCRALGFPLGGEVLEPGSYGYDTGLVWMDRVGCNGHENGLDECPHRDHESHTCDHSSDAAVRCFLPPEEVIASKPRCPDGSEGPDCSCREDEFRCKDRTCIPRAAKCDGDAHCEDGSDEDGCTKLVGGPDGSMGKLVVEMYGEDHRFCSERLGDTEASVICRELGYSNGGVSTNVPFVDTGEKALGYNFHCEGTEKRFVECGVAMSKRETCSYEELAGVKCKTEAGILNMPQPQVDFVIPFDSGKVDVRMCQDMSKVTQDLWEADQDRLSPGAIMLNPQAELEDFGPVQDQSVEKLFAFVNESKLTSPVYRTFMALLDNYDPFKNEPEMLIPQEIIEEDAFLDAIMSTANVKILYNYLFCLGQVQDMSDLRELLRNHWFELYPRSGKSSVLDTSGFEHMVGEFKSTGSVSGMHSWLSFYQKEKRGELNYYGQTCSAEPNTACPAFEWQKRIKRKATFFLGTSPAYDLAIYSLCFITHKNEHCPVVVDGRPMVIKTHSKGGHIATAYLAF